MQHEQLKGWVNAHYGELRNASDYISEEFINSLDFDDPYSIDTGDLDAQEEILDILEYLTLPEDFQGYNKVDIHAALERLKGKMEKYLKGLETINWSNKEDVEYVIDQLSKGCYHNDLQGINKEVDAHIKDWHPENEASFDIKIEKETNWREGTTHYRWVDPYYDIQGEEYDKKVERLKAKLKSLGLDPEKIVVTGDDSGDYISMAFSCFTDIKEFLQSHCTWGTQKKWEAILKDSKIFQEFLDREKYIFYL